MKQIIILESYCGLSSFVYNASCTGRRLEIGELIEFGLTSKDEIHRYRDSEYGIAGIRLI